MHQCDSLIVPELGEYKAGLAMSQQIRLKLRIVYTEIFRVQVTVFVWVNVTLKLHDELLVLIIMLDHFKVCLVSDQCDMPGMVHFQNHFWSVS